MKNIDKAGKFIKRGRNRRSKKKSKHNFLNIEKLTNEAIYTIEKQLTIGLTNELLSIKSEKLVPLRFKTKI